MDDTYTIHFDSGKDIVITLYSEPFRYISKNGKDAYELVFKTRKFIMNNSLPRYTWFRVIMPDGEDVLCYAGNWSEKILIEHIPKRIYKQINAVC